MYAHEFGFSAQYVQKKAGANVHTTREQKKGCTVAEVQKKRVGNKVQRKNGTHDVNNKVRNKCIENNVARNKNEVKK